MGFEKNTEFEFEFGLRIPVVNRIQTLCTERL